MTSAVGLSKKQMICPRFSTIFLAGLHTSPAVRRTPFDKWGVNEYRAGAGIGWHKDKPQFEIVVGVSLLLLPRCAFGNPAEKTG